MSETTLDEILAKHGAEPIKSIGGRATPQVERREVMSEFDSHRKSLVL